MLADSNPISKQLSERPEVIEVLPQVSAGGEISRGRWRSSAPVFGVDFAAYFRFFPALRVVEGSVVALPGGRVFMSEPQYRMATVALGYAPPLGTAFSLAAYNNSTFTIREVNLQGVYRYPAGDALLDRIVLVDPDTARALNGYTTRPEQSQPLSAGTELDSLDQLFGGTADLSEAAPEALSIQGVEAQLADTDERDRLNRALPDSWNFLLVKGDLRHWSVPNGFQVRDWRASAGGNATIIWLVQLLFNIGMGLVLAGSAIIVINSLALAIVERTREIGTMRALGATKLVVGTVVGLEVLLVVVLSGLVGLSIGSSTVAVLSWTGIVLDNPYLVGLFGAGVVRPTLTLALLVQQFALVLGLGVVAFVLPVRLALRVSPGQAMARGA